MSQFVVVHSDVGGVEQQSLGSISGEQVAFVSVRGLGVSGQTTSRS